MPGFAVIRQGRSEHTGDAPLTAGTRHRFSLFLLFLVQGIALSSWVTRTPDVRDAVHASTAQMGLILFGLSIGSMVSVLSAGPLVARFGTRSVAVNGTCCIAVSMPVVALGTAVHLGALVALGLCFYGLGIGSVEVALNVDGARSRRTPANLFSPRYMGSSVWVPSWAPASESPSRVGASPSPGICCSSGCSLERDCWWQHDSYPAEQAFAGEPPSKATRRQANHFRA